MVATIRMLFFGAATIFFVLWFLDEIMSVKNIKQYGLKGVRNPVIKWLLQHHIERMIYVKSIIYAFSIIFLAEIIKKYLEYFHLGTLILILVYLVFDIHILRLLKKRLRPTR